MKTLGGFKTSLLLLDLTSDDKFEVAPCPVDCGKKHNVYVTYRSIGKDGVRGGLGGVMVFTEGTAGGTGGTSETFHWVGVTCPLKDKQFGIRIGVPPGKAVRVDRVDSE